MKKTLKILTALFASAVVLASCGTPKQTSVQTNSTSTESSKPAASKGKLKIAFIGRSTGNPYVEKSLEGFKKAVEETGNEAIIKAPDQATAEGQIAMVEELISQQVNAIAVASNDFDGLTPVLKKAASNGIKVVSVDSAVNPEARLAHINQADPEAIGRTLIRAASEMIGGDGEIAILSATSQAANQNLWIDWMKKELQDPKYSKIKLVKIAYGDDVRDKSVSETEALLKTYPNLKCIIAPTTVGIAAAGKVLTDKGLKGKVQLTGLGLPSEMSEYIENGVCKWMYLWNPLDLGYLTGYVCEELASNKITGAAGEKFKAGKLGDKSIIKVGDGTEIMLGDPFKFDSSNIEEWKKVY